MFLVVGSVSPTAAGALLVFVGCVAAAILVVLLARGVHGHPEFARRLRRIGEPDAWRGIERQ